MADVDTDSLLNENWPPSPSVRWRSCSETDSATTDKNGRKKTEKNARNATEFLISIDLGKVWPPLEPSTTMHGGEFPFAYQHRLGFVKFMRKWEPRWPSILKQSMTRSVEGQNQELQEEIKREMEEVAKETDIAFTTDVWTSPTGESFMTMSMHWISWDWHLKTRILGMTSFPKDHTTVNI